MNKSIPLAKESAHPSLLPGLYLFFYVVCIGLFPFLVLGPFGDRFDKIIPRALAYILSIAIGTALLKVAREQVSWTGAALITGLVYGAVYRLAVFIPDVSTYPFTLGWSEGSRYYYASLFFSQHIYGISVPLSVLHPTRYLMQAAPFLIPGLPIWVHRLWQVLLWVVFSLWAAFLLEKRLPVQGRWQKWFFVLWAFLFLLQGPVYYHLLVMVILVLWGYDEQKPWRTWLVVLAASAWAGVSRVNWLPVPGMLAAALYFLETGLQKKSFWRYLLKPAAWTAAGSAVGFVVQKAYTLWSGNPPAWFGSSFTSDLLWYRLFPSATYPLGVWPAVFVVTLPLLLIAVLRLAPRWRDYHPVRWLALAAILFVLFAGGTVVSAKIGGGSNLHNMDAYLVLLLVTGSFIAYGKFQPDRGEVDGSFRLPQALLALAVAIPVLFAIGEGNRIPTYDFARARSDLAALKQTVEQSAQNGGQVLFISERQLLTFKDINVPLVPNDEKVFLMEMAMSNNQAYLSQFYDDLRNHRFAYIVSHPLKLNYQGGKHIFGEENDAWVLHVSEQVLCYYQPQVKMPEVNIWLFTPRSNTGSCP
ncbi:MAG: hypothetical protein ACM3PY_03690 [Omnitrophica WOR_2 bacterium]